VASFKKPLRDRCDSDIYVSLSSLRW